jgi:hypothetical protein
MRSILTPKLGSVATQKLQSIREGCIGKNFTLLKRISDAARSVSNIGLISDMQCGGCLKNMHRKGKLLEHEAFLCVICGRQFCPSCISEIEMSVTSDKSFNLPSCKSSCARFLKSLQLELDPWHNSSASSHTLFDLAVEVNREHTQLLSRLSNFEGLARFFMENSDRVPQRDILNTMPELEESVKRGIDTMTSLIRKIQSVDCPSYNVPVKRSLVTFCTGQLGKVKAQFHLSSSIYETLVNSNRSFSPRPVHSAGK